MEAIEKEERSFIDITLHLKYAIKFRSSSAKSFLKKEALRSKSTLESLQCKVKASQWVHSPKAFEESRT